MADIAVRIKDARKKAGKTQKWLADSIKVSQTAVALWENGSRQPTAEIIEQIANVLNVSPSYLMGWDIPEGLTYIGGGFYGKEAPAEMQERFLKRMTAYQSRFSELMTQLNEDGQKEAVKRMEELTEIPKYQKKD